MTEPLSPAPEEEEIKTRTAVILGRTITMQEPSQLQASVIARSYRRAQRLIDILPPNAKLTTEQTLIVVDSMAKFLDVIGNLIVGQEDQDWVEDMMVQGKIRNWDDLGGLTDALIPEQEAPNRAARRGKR